MKMKVTCWTTTACTTRRCLWFSRAILLVSCCRFGQSLDAQNDEFDFIISNHDDLLEDVKNRYSRDGLIGLGGNADGVGEATATTASGLSPKLSSFLAGYLQQQQQRQSNDNKNNKGEDGRGDFESEQPQLVEAVSVSYDVISRTKDGDLYVQITGKSGDATILREVIHDITNVEPFACAPYMCSAVLSIDMLNALLEDDEVVSVSPILAQLNAFEDARAIDIASGDDTGSDGDGDGDNSGVVDASSTVAGEANEKEGSDGGSVLSEGARSMNSDTLGLTGDGVKIGVISDSFNCLGGADTDVATGDLSADYVILEETPDCAVSGNSDEGRAMMQLIHDVAPGAKLYFHSGWAGEPQFAQAMQAFADNEVDITVDDLGYVTSPFFQYVHVPSS